MAEEVNIGNVGGTTGVASEATLVRLLSVMEAMSRRNGGKGGGADKTQEQYNKAQKSGILVVTKNSDALKDNTDKVKRHSRALSGAIKGLTSLTGAVLGQVIGGLTNLASVTMGSSTELKDFAETVPFVGKYLGALAGVIDTNLAAFRSLSSQGAIFGDGVLGMTRAAASAGMPLTDFVGLIQDNAERMQMFGGTTTQAAMTFASMSKQFRDGPGKELVKIGFSFGDLNELLLDYAEYQDMQLGIQSRSDNISLKSAKEYGEQLQELAAITGKNRKQIADEMRQRLQDSRQQQALDMMDADQRENFERVQAIAGKFGPMMSEAVLDMADGIPTKDSVAASLMPMSETFRNQAKDLKNMSRKEQEQFFVTVNAEAAEYKRKFGQSYQAVIAQGGPMADAFRASMEIAKARVTTDQELEEERKRMIAEASKDNAIKDFQTTIIALRARFEEIFFASDGPLEKLTTYFNSLLTKITSPENLEKFENGVKAASDALVRLFEKIETIVLNIKKYDLKTAIFGGKKDDVLADGTVLEEDVQGIFGDPNSDGGLSNLLGSAIGSVITNMFTGWEIPWGTVFVGGLAALGTLIAAPVLGIPGALLAGLTAIFGVQAVKDMFSGAVDVVKGVGTAISDTWDDTKTAISEKFTAAKNNVVAIGTKISDTWDDTKNAISEKWVQAKGLVSNVAGKIRTAWEDGTITEKYNNAKTFLTDVGSKIGTAFSNIDWDKYSIKDQFGKVWDAITGFFTFDFTMPNFRDFLPTWLGGKGREIGEKENLPPEMEAKVQEQLPDPTDATAKAGVLQEAKQAVATIIDIPTLKNALTAIKEGMNTNQVKSYAEALRDVADQLIAINEAAKDQETTIQSRRGTKTVNQKSAAAGVLDGSTPFGQNAQTGSLDTLNTTMLAILEELQNQTPSIKKTAKETSGNVATSVIPISN